MGKKLRNAVTRFDRLTRSWPMLLRPVGRLIVGACHLALGSVVSARAEETRVALTFDDGPDSQETGRILDVLQSRGAKASFFMLANRAEERPDLLRRVIDEGHEACLHGANHDNLTRLRTREVIDRIWGGKKRLEVLTETRTSFFRPPYGEQNLRSYAVARLSGMTPVLWTAWGDDWEELTPTEIVERSLERLESGGILLLHDGFEPNPDHPSSRPTYDRVDMVTGILDGMNDKGLTPTTVSELLHHGGRNRVLWFEY